MNTAITGHQPFYPVIGACTPAKPATRPPAAAPTGDQVRLQIIRKVKAPPLFDIHDSKALDAGALAAGGLGAVASFGAGAIASGALKPVHIKDAAVASRRAMPALSGLTLAAAGAAGMAGGLVARKSDSALGSVGLGAVAGGVSLAGSMAVGMLIGRAALGPTVRQTLAYGAMGMAAGGIGGVVEHLFHRSQAD